MELYLCRHGETEWSRSGKHTGKADVPLTETGKKQALLLRKRLQGVSFEAVLTSPRKRAVDTCEGLGASPEPLLAEWDYGDFEGLTTVQILATHPDWDLFTQGTPGGESPEQIGKRADQLLQKLAPYRGKIALFSHGHFLRVLAARYLGLPVHDARLFLLSVSSLSILGHERATPAIALWNDTHHLH